MQMPRQMMPTLIFSALVNPVAVILSQMQEACLIKFYGKQEKPGNWL